MQDKINIEEYEENHEDIPKYRKRKEKNPWKKATHKHTYKRCRLIIKDSSWDFLQHNEMTAEYCTICGRIKDKTFNLSEYILLLKEKGEKELEKEEKDVLKRYRKLEVFEIGDMQEKYVGLSNT